LSSAALAALLPKGRCRLLLGASIGLASISASFALAPALILYAIAAVFYYHIGIGGLTVMQIVFAAIGAAIVRLTLLLWARLAAGNAMLEISSRLRTALATKIGTLPLGELTQGRPVTFAAQLLDDVERIGAFVTGEFVDLVGSTAMIVVAAALIAWRDWRLTALLAILLVAGRLVAGRRATLGTQAVERERRASDALAAALLAALRASPAAQTLPPVAPGTDPLAGYAADYRRAIAPRARHAATSDAGWRAYAGAIPALLLLAALGLGGRRLDLPALVLVVALGLRIGGALTATLGASRAVAPARESAQRIRTSLAQPPQRGGDRQPGADRSVRFAGVSFAYPQRTEPVLREIDFSAEAGAVTAIVGPSGSGKTTLMRLAAGFWNPDRGRVEIGGIAVPSIESDALARQTAYVFQDVALLDDTIGANLRLGRPDADDAAVAAAAQAAGAHAFISALPEGYDTLVGNRGLRLSRGERQRLQIARALLKDAPIVLLDEPTASLDPATEAAVHQALGALVRGKTVLVVTHRLSTIVNADKIVVLDRNGRIEASGTHAQLLAGSATYAQLWSDENAAVDWAQAQATTAG
jgi:ATP-binding cassette subfamily B protein